VTNFNAWFDWNLPWPLFAFAAALLISILCWYDVELSVKILPKALGKTHPTHKSPYVASVFQTGIAVLLVLAWGIGAGFGDEFETAYVRIYTMMAVQGVVWLMAIQTVCALAVLIWHRRHKHPDSWVVVVLCPIIAIAGQVFALYLLFANIDTLAGTIGYVDLIGPIAVVGVLVALGYALWLKRTNRKKFDVIGRMIDEGVTAP
jgi:amino acid transporter